MTGRPAKRDPVFVLMRVLDAARDYSRFVIFKPDRPAAKAREDLQRAIADYDDVVSDRDESEGASRTRHIIRADLPRRDHADTEGRHNVTVADDLATIKEDSALLADWAEEPTAISNVDADNCRARIVAAVESVKAEIARLHELHLSRTKTTNQDLRALIERAEAAEAREARLQDGLRPLVRNIDRYDAVMDPNPPSAGDLLWRIRDDLRALLAEDGAS